VSAPNYNLRFFVVLSAAVLWFTFLMWLVFHPHLLAVLSPAKAWGLGLSCACIVPLFFYPFLAKRHAGSGLGLAFMAGALALISLEGIAYFAFSIDNAWSDGLHYTSQLLVFVAMLIFIRQAVRKSREKKEPPK
jgi:hypothetical protein